MRVARNLLLVAVSTCLASGFLPSAPQENWTRFKNKAGWQISYPSSWRLSSCSQCIDPSDGIALVILQDPAGKASIIVDRLIDKPANLTDDEWLQSVSVRILPPGEVQKEKFGWIDSRRALFGLSPIEKGEFRHRILVVNGTTTISISSRVSPSSWPLYRRIIATLHFQNSAAKP